MVADAPLQLPRQIADQIAEHARAGLPDEACGIVSGVDATATRFHPAINADASPFRYSIDAQDLLRIVTDIDDAEEDLLAIYHSHTRSPAFPSRTDVELAFWPALKARFVAPVVDTRTRCGLPAREKHGRTPS